MSRSGIALGRFTALVLLGLAALLFLLFESVLGGSRAAVLQTSEILRRNASRAVAARVQEALGEAEVAVADVETDISKGLLDPHDVDAVEARLYGALLHHADLAEASWTFGRAVGDDADGYLQLAPGTRGQIAVERTRDGRLITRYRHEEAGGWVMDARPRTPGGGFASADRFRTHFVPIDPTEHPTFSTPASARFRGMPLWSDLAFSPLDDALPENLRRKEMTVQKALLDAGGVFAGVLRAGLDAEAIERAGQLKVSSEANDPHRIFLCDRRGRLVTRLSPDDSFADMDGDVRVVAAHPDPAIAAALASPALAGVTADAPAFTTMSVGGTDYFVTVAALPDDRTRGWLVGVVAPAAFYLRGLDATRDRLIWLSALLALAVLAGGALALRALRRGLGLVVGETRRIQRFDFGAARRRATFAEVNDALGSLEIAKAALRAMGRYVPVELVRLLFRAGREPELGGEPRDVTMMFSDIAGFTTLSETMAPNELAAALGRYLEVVAAAARDGGGTVDKFIGDAVMVLWNAPLDTPEHSRRACQTALAAKQALAELFASPEWGGRPPWTTRFGLHRDTVLVGHFGAPDRMSYTALGDGVNLASRIEGLNKVYGTTILVSDAVRAEAGDGFVFRRLDRVAVKGKSRAVELHELVGRRGEVDERAAGAYEGALAHYFEGRFEIAAELLQSRDDDAPSQVLLARCRRLAASPPVAWDGVYRAETK